MARSKARIQWKRGAFRELRTLPAAMADLAKRGEQIARAAGDGYESSGSRASGGRGRGRVTVKTATTSARRRESRDHTLLKALGAGKG